jgi:pilus assembly protein Flp/PilA
MSRNSWEEIMKALAMRFLRDEEGASAIEYVLIGGLVAVAIVGGMVVFGPAVSNWFTNTGNYMTNNATPK